MDQGRASPTDRAPPSAVCGGCGAEGRYRCPGCDARSCSLTCVRAHKAATGCIGRRDPSQWCAIGQFDDHVVQRDYQFLEGVLRAVDSSKRRRLDPGPAGAPSGRGALPPVRHHLLRGARERGAAGPPSISTYSLDISTSTLPLRVPSLLPGVHLELQPAGMLRERQNSSRYDGRRKVLTWRVEFLFPAAGVRHVRAAPCPREGR